MVFLRLGLLKLLVAVGFAVIAADGTASDRAIILYNNSGARVEVNWFNVDNGDRALMSDPDVLAGAEFNMNSFVSHRFEIRELPAKKTNKCAQEECRTAFFTVNENQQQYIEVDLDFQVKHIDHKTKAQDDASRLLAACKENAVKDLRSGMTSEQVLDRTAVCMQTPIFTSFKRFSDDLTYEVSLRRQMAKSYENYTCMDFELDSSEPIYSTVWIDPKTQRAKDVGVMLDRPASKIHLIEDFITEEECDAMEREAEPTLTTAVTADGTGGHKVSKNRKAMQAGIVVPWEKEHENHPIATISRRVYNYVNDAMGLNINEDGQENLMSIQYFADTNNTRNLTYDDYDQYFPHCDGDCLGDPLMIGGRVATMVVYCTIPKRGGATNFRNAGLHIRPKKGSAVFFSYYNPNTGLMDTGFTEHSGCPVVEGEKKIVTQWVRLGLTKNVPWTAYNSLGLLKSNIDEEDS